MKTKEAISTVQKLRVVIREQRYGLDQQWKIIEAMQYKIEKLEMELRTAQITLN